MALRLFDVTVDPTTGAMVIDVRPPVNLRSAQWTAFLGALAVAAIVTGADLLAGSGGPHGGPRDAFLFAYWVGVVTAGIWVCAPTQMVLHDGELLIAVKLLGLAFESHRFGIEPGDRFIAVPANGFLPEGFRSSALLLLGSTPVALPSSAYKHEDAQRVADVLNSCLDQAPLAAAHVSSSLNCTTEP